MVEMFVGYSSPPRAHLKFRGELGDAKKCGEKGMSGTIPQHSFP